MSSFRVSVEHNFKNIKKLWISQYFAPNVKVRIAPVGLLCKAIVLLCNFHTCAHRGGQTIAGYQVMPPKLDE